MPCDSTTSQILSCEPFLQCNGCHPIERIVDDPVEHLDQDLGFLEQTATSIVFEARSTPVFDVYILRPAPVPSVRLEVVTKSSSSLSSWYGKSSCDDRLEYRFFKAGIIDGLRGEDLQNACNDLEHVSACEMIGTVCGLREAPPIVVVTIAVCCSIAVDSKASVALWLAPISPRKKERVRITSTKELVVCARVQCQVVATIQDAYGIGTTITNV